MTSDRARLIGPPPLLVVGCIVIGFIAGHFQALPLLPSRSVWEIVLGSILVIVAVAVIASARRTFIARGTHVNPYRPTTAVVTTGIYRFTRNPIYISFLLVLLAFGFLTNSLWFVLTTPLLFLLLHFGVVRREETYLLGKFGEPYRQYCGRVRRWI